MKNIFAPLLLLSTAIFSAHIYAEPTSTCKEVKFQKADQAWSGHYYLHGVMEVGSELLLQPDGKFKWMLAVGALDQYAEGTWWKNGGCIGLKPEAKFKKDLSIFPESLTISDKSLDAIWEGGRQQGTYSKRLNKKSDTESDFFYSLYFSDSPQQVAERYSEHPCLGISQ